MLTRIVLASLALIGVAQAQQPAYAQCGGSGWTGGTTCVAGYVCTYSNQWYSQCLPGSTTANPTSTTTRPTTTGVTSTSTPTTAPTGKQIRGVTAPVYHLYLQNSNGTAVLGPEASGGSFTISGTIKLNSSPALYLNIGNETTSYKSLTFGSTATFSGWGLEGDTIITTTSSSFGRQLNYVACPGTVSGTYRMYLQTGSAMPSSSCTNYLTMHLPCLC